MNNIVFNYVLEVLAILANAATVLGGSSSNGGRSISVNGWKRKKTEKPAGTGFPNH